MNSADRDPALDRMPTPRVSVVMPAFNVASTIAQAIRSVLAQSMNELELIVCDDASSDETVSTVQGFVDPRVSLLVNSQNLGPGPSRDRAISAARAPLVALLDADDAWLPDRLQTLLAALGKDPDVMVFDDAMICHDSGGTMVPWRPVHGRFAFGADGSNAQEVLLEDYIRAERLLIHPVMPVRVIREHGLRHTDRRFAEDAEFYIRLGLAGVTMRYVPKPLYLYRVAPGSLTAVGRDRTLMRRCLEDCARLDDVPDTIRRALADKIVALRTNEALYKLADQFRRGNLVGILRILANEPRALLVLPRRLARHLSYQAHRIKHGAQGR